MDIPAGRRIVVAGGGMVGIKFAAAMAHLDATADVRVFGDEPAYDRTQLIHLLDGTRSREAILRPCVATLGRISAIDRPAKVLRLEAGAGEASAVPYDILVIATGAKPVRPDVPGIGHAHTLRRLADVDRIVARSPRSATVVGGGALGLETADALSARGCAVTVVHAADRIMERHLDAPTSRALREALERLGMRFVLDARLESAGPDFVDVGGIRLHSDVVLVATGVVPDDALAKAAGLLCDRGVIVDDDMRTSDPAIFAIGDCVRHAGQSPCLLQRGYEQAHIAAKAIADVHRWAAHATPAPAIMLKTRYRAQVVGRVQGAPIEYRSAEGVRKLWLAEGCLVGAIVLGEWDKFPLLRQAIDRGEYLSASARTAFRWCGDPWPWRHLDPGHWPGHTVVCQCNGVSLAAVRAAVQAGATNVDAVGRNCGAGTGCTGCRPLLSRLLGARPEAVAHRRKLLAAAGAALLATLLPACGGMPFSASFAWRWDVIWRDFALKQISGYALLAVGILLAVTGVARRSARLPPARKNALLGIHAAAAIAAVAGLLVHSGGRTGQGVALLLSIAWAGTLLAGGAQAVVFARAHRSLQGMSSPAARAAGWLHVLLLWPLPVFLAAHVAGAYLWS